MKRCWLLWMLSFGIVLAEEKKAKVGGPKELVISKFAMLSLDVQSLNQVAALYLEYSGKKLTVVDGDDETNIPIYARGPLSRGELVRFIEASLEVNGWAVSGEEGGEKGLTLEKTEVSKYGEKAKVAPVLGNDKFLDSRVISKDGEMSLLSTTGLSLFRIFESHSGLRVVASRDLLRSEFNLVVKGAATNREIVSEIWKSLRAIGLGMVPDEKQAGLLKVVVAEPEKFKEHREKKNPENRVRRTRYVPRAH